MDALILVDIQNDFLAGGALAVPDGNRVIPVANRLLGSTGHQHFDLVVATQDWHPPDHLSFASQHEDHDAGDVIELGGLEQVLWPDHCVQGTDGARLAPGLRRLSIARVFQKGTDRRIDSYSGFFDNGHRKSTGMGEWLKEQSVDRVTVMGLATDYCVRFTALDAAELGFAVRLVEDGCRGVELEEGDVAAALEQMQEAGVQLVQSADLLKTR